TVITSVVRSSTSSVISPLVVGEGDGLAADGEVAPLRPADVVLGQEDAGQVGVAAEDDAEEVEGFALLELGGGEQLDAGVDLWERVLTWIGEKRLDTQALDSVAVEELVVDREARLSRKVVGRVQAGEEAVALARGVAQPAEHGEHVRGGDREACAPLLEATIEHCPGMVLLDLPPDQLESGSVRHRSAPWPARRPPPPRRSVRCAARPVPTPRCRGRRSGCASPGRGCPGSCVAAW